MEIMEVIFLHMVSYVFYNIRYAMILFPFDIISFINIIITIPYFVHRKYLDHNNM